MKTSNYAVVRLLRNIHGTRWDGKQGDTRIFRWINKTPDTVVSARHCGEIDWGGCLIPSEFYAITYDGVGLPKEILS